MAMTNRERVGQASGLLEADPGPSNFGGAATHSMLARYHLFSGRRYSSQGAPPRRSAMSKTSAKAASTRSARVPRMTRLVP